MQYRKQQGRTEDRQVSKEERQDNKEGRLGRKEGINDSTKKDKEVRETENVIK